jgi:hypothetical protein
MRGVGWGGVGGGSHVCGVETRTHQHPIVFILHPSLNPTRVRVRTRRLPSPTKAPFAAPTT